MAKCNLKKYLKTATKTGLESETGEPLTSITDSVIETSEDAVAVEVVFLEVEEAECKVEEVESDIEEFDAAQTGLEQIAESLETSLEAGGLDPIAAQFAHHAVDAVGANIGVSSESIVLSLESFGGETGKINATQVSLEGVKETITAVIEAIANALEKSLKFISDMIAKIFGGADAVIKRCKALEAVAAKVTGEAGEITVKNPDTIALGGSVKGADVIKGLEASVSVGKTLFGEYVPAVTKSIKSAIELSTKGKDLKQEEVVEYVHSAAKIAAGILDKVADTVVSGDYVFGEDLQLGLAKDKSAKKPVAKVPALTSAEMKSVLTAVMAVAEGIKSAKSGIDGLVTARKEAVAKIKSIKDANKNGITVAKVLQKESTRPITGYGAKSFSSARSAIGMVETSIKAYKPKKEEKA